MTHSVIRSFGSPLRPRGEFFLVFDPDAIGSLRSDGNGARGSQQEDYYRYTLDVIYRTGELQVVRTGTLLCCLALISGNSPSRNRLTDSKRPRARAHARSKPRSM